MRAHSPRTGGPASRNSGLAYGAASA